MKISILLGGLIGLAFGAIVGWLSFGSAISGVGVGISLGFAVCGTLIAFELERRK